MLYERIKRARKQSKITLDNLSKSLSIGRTTLIDYEKGNSEPKVSTVIKMSEICTVDTNWLLTGKGEMKIASTPSNATIQLGDNNNNIIVGNGNGSININTEKFNHKEDIKDIIELLEFAPAGFLTIIKEKLLAFKKMSHF
ncbi:MAG: helix-turn-helix transcriptional regulator [Sulfurovum sp.]|nr:helix-turn-helix transcriptional regulator [Sulfurovum sp.]